MLTNEPPEAGLVVFGFAGALVPVAIGIAILRHGLYDIDRLISRTVGYAAITAVLAVVFAVAALVLGVVLSTVAEGQTIAVAGSTLLVAALVRSAPTARPGHRRPPLRPFAVRRGTDGPGHDRPVAR